MSRPTMFLVGLLYHVCGSHVGAARVLPRKVRAMDEGSDTEGYYKVGPLR